MTWVVVGLAGAAGALLRHEATSRASDGLAVLHVCNVLGALVLGLVAGALPGRWFVAALGLGGLGALTSFSTWMVEARERPGAVHHVVPLVLAVAAAVAGTLVGRWLGGLP